MVSIKQLDEFEAVFDRTLAALDKSNWGGRTIEIKSSLDVLVEGAFNEAVAQSCKYLTQKVLEKIASIDSADLVEYERIEFEIRLTIQAVWIHVNAARGMIPRGT